jgi:transcriptional regulator with XRE-family HTH domain
MYADSLGYMTDRKAKITNVNLEEARLLKHLWDTRDHPSQAEFGHLYGIGNQSVVSQFLRGTTPLSLKAARGFAAGLACKVEDFSPRLAAEAAAIANMVPSDRLSAETALLAAEIDRLPETQRQQVLLLVRQAIDLAKRTSAMYPPRKIFRKQG